MSFIDGVFAGFNLWALGYVLGAMLLCNIIFIQAPIFVMFVCGWVYKKYAERKQHGR